MNKKKHRHIHFNLVLECACFVFSYTIYENTSVCYTKRSINLFNYENKDTKEKYSLTYIKMMVFV